MIEVHKIDDSTFDVSVKGSITTHHRVTLSSDYYEQLTGGDISPEMLLKKSFEFLLQRESNTAILEAFDLQLISQYFPEFEQEMKSSSG